MVQKLRPIWAAFFSDLFRIAVNVLEDVIMSSIQLISSIFSKSLVIELYESDCYSLKYMYIVYIYLFIRKPRQIIAARSNCCLCVLGATLSCKKKLTFGLFFSFESFHIIFEAFQIYSFYIFFAFFTIYSIAFKSVGVKFPNVGVETMVKEPKRSFIVP